MSLKRSCNRRQIIFLCSILAYISLGFSFSAIWMRISGAERNNGNILISHRYVFFSLKVTICILIFMLKIHIQVSWYRGWNRGLLHRFTRDVAKHSNPSLVGKQRQKSFWSVLESSKYSWSSLQQHILASKTDNWGNILLVRRLLWC